MKGQQVMTLPRAPRRYRKRSRDGFTLIEMMLVLVLTGSLLGAVIGLLSLARQSQEQARGNLFQRQEIRRFAGDLRRDVRSAGDSRLVDGRMVLSVGDPARAIVYSVQPDSIILREVKDPNVKGESTHVYRVGRNAKIEVGWLEAPDVVRWVITESDRPNQPVRIVASRKGTP